jgi:aspartyl-tRNA(Asn)/glutamyl-tRNA(Gln) amidotransferase subunit A
VITGRKTMNKDLAFKTIEELANGNYRGALHGIPMALKDMLYFKDESLKNLL